MKMETVCLDGMPRPHYLTSAVVRSLGGGDGYTLEGVVIFPSTDVTIGDRDHVNVSHAAFASWNAAHVIAREGATNLRACGTVRIRPLEEILPDVPVNIRATAQVERRIRGAGYGSFKVSFYDQGGNTLLSTLETNFICTLTAP